MNPTIHPGATGDDVATLDQALLEAGLLPPEADAERAALTYGPITEGAVRTLQAKHGLDVDGIVGPKTWDAISVGTDAPASIPAPDYASMPPLMARALELADGELRRGVAEVPLGSNRGPDVDAYLRGRRDDGRWLLQFRADSRYPGGWQGAPWCARFALWCVEGAAAALGVAPPTTGWGDLAAASKWAERARTAGRWQSTPAPGDIGCILVPGGDGKPAHGHVVLVASVDGSDVLTREGNSANKVRALRREAAQFAGFVRLA